MTEENKIFNNWIEIIITIPALMVMGLLEAHFPDSGKYDSIWSVGGFTGLSKYKVFDSMNEQGLKKWSRRRLLFITDA